MFTKSKLWKKIASCALCFLMCAMTIAGVLSFVDIATPKVSAYGEGSCQWSANGAAVLVPAHVMAMYPYSDTTGYGTTTASHSVKDDAIKIEQGQSYILCMVNLNAAVFGTDPLAAFNPAGGKLEHFKVFFSGGNATIQAYKQTSADLNWSWTTAASNTISGDNNGTYKVSGSKDMGSVSGNYTHFSALKITATSGTVYLDSIAFYATGNASSSDALFAARQKSHHFGVKVTYDGNGHTGGSVPSAATQWISDGYTKIDLDTSKVPTKTGYTFLGWKLTANGDGGISKSVLNITIGNLTGNAVNNVTVKAQWGKNYDITYEVYHPDTGQLAETWKGMYYTAPSVITDKFTLDAGRTVDGYLFYRWEVTSISATENMGWSIGNRYKESSKHNCNAFAGEVTLRAVLVKEYNITYLDTNNQPITGLTPDGYSALANVTLPNYTDPRGAILYTFNGWELVANPNDPGSAPNATWVAFWGGETYLPKATVLTIDDTIVGDVYLKINITPTNFKYRLDPNVGTLPGYGGDEIIDFVYDVEQDITLLIPTRNGYTFAGWKITTNRGNWTTRFTELYGSATANNTCGPIGEGFYGAAANDVVVLTAQWTANTYDVYLVLPKPRDDGYGGVLAATYTECDPSVLAQFTGYSGLPAVPTDFFWKEFGVYKFSTATYTVKGDAQSITYTAPTFVGYDFAATPWTAYNAEGGPLPTAMTAAGRITYGAYCYGNMLLVSNWTPHAYEYYLYPASGTIDGGITANTAYSYTIEDTVELPIATRGGYTFGGWTVTQIYASQKGNWTDKFGMNYNFAPGTGFGPGIWGGESSGTAGYRHILTAQWDANTYPIYIILPNGTGDVAGKTGLSPLPELDAAYVKVTDPDVIARVGTLIGEYGLTIPDIMLYKDGYGGYSVYQYHVNGNPITHTTGTATSATVSIPAFRGYTNKAWVGRSELKTDLGVTTAGALTAAAGNYGDVIYVAAWTPTSFTITFDPNLGTIEGLAADAAKKVTYTVESEYVDVPVIRYPGNTLLNWKLSALTAAGSDGFVLNEFYNFKSGGTIDLNVYLGTGTLLAQWTAGTYNVFFDLNGGYWNEADLPDKKEYTFSTGTNIINFTNPTRYGYTFNATGWTYKYLTEDCALAPTRASTKITLAAKTYGDIQFTASWTPVSYTIKYSVATSPALKLGGVLVAGGDTTYDVESGTLTLATAYRPGFKFCGWRVFSTSVADGGWTVGEIIPAVYTDEGTFVCEFDPANRIGNLVFEPVWEAIDYHIYFQLPEGSQWNESDLFYDVTEQVRDNPNFYAQGYRTYVCVDYPTYQSGDNPFSTMPMAYRLGYNHTWVIVGAYKTPYDSANAKCVMKVPTVGAGNNDPAVTWAVTINTGGTGATSGDLVFRATAELVTYTITYSRNSGTFVPANGGAGTTTAPKPTYNVLDTIRLLYAYRDGYAFTGWKITYTKTAGDRIRIGSLYYEDGDIITDMTIYPGEIAGDFTLTAQWSNVAGNLNDIYYDLQGGTWPEGATPLSEYKDETGGTQNLALYPETDAPYRLGYTFSEWTADFASNSTACGITAIAANNGNFRIQLKKFTHSDMTLKAVWTPVEYTITLGTSQIGTYDLDNGISITHPKRGNYLLSHYVVKEVAEGSTGWQVGDVIYVNADGTYDTTARGTGNITVEAVWIRTGSPAKIEYVLGSGGSWNNYSPIVSYVEGSTVEILVATPNRIGYTFTGWSTPVVAEGSSQPTLSGPDADGFYTLSIDKDTYGTITLTANWDIVTYKVTIKWWKNNTTTPANSAWQYKELSYNAETTALDIGSYLSAALGNSRRTNIVVGKVGDTDVNGWTVGQIVATYNGNGDETLDLSGRSGDIWLYTQYIFDGPAGIPEKDDSGEYPESVDTDQWTITYELGDNGEWYLNDAPLNYMFNIQSYDINNETKIFGVPYALGQRFTSWTWVKATSPFYIRCNNDTTASHRVQAKTNLVPYYSDDGETWTDDPATLSEIRYLKFWLIERVYGDFTVTANYEAVTYNVSYNLGTLGGSLPGDAPATYLTANGLSLPVPTAPTGYRFAGWKVTAVSDWYTGAGGWDVGKTYNGTIDADTVAGHVTLEAQWVRLGINIHYVPVVDGEINDKAAATSKEPVWMNLPDEDIVASLSGTTATPRRGWKFVGWYADVSCTGEPLSTDTAFKPTLEQLFAQSGGSRPEADVSFYAKYEPAMTTVTITETGNGNQTYLYRIHGKPELVDRFVHVNLLVQVKAGETVTITLPAGEYVINEQCDWSWKVAADGGVEIPEDGRRVTVATVSYTDEAVNVSVTHTSASDGLYNVYADVTKSSPSISGGEDENA